MILLKILNYFSQCVQSKVLHTCPWAKCIVSTNCPTYTRIRIRFRIPIRIHTRIHFRIRPFLEQCFGFVDIKELKERDVSITQAEVMVRFRVSVSDDDTNGPQIKFSLYAAQ